MSLYVWGCGNCGKETEVVKKVADIDVPPEPCCDQPDFRRLPPKGVGRSFGRDWSKTSWKDGKGGKGTW